MTDSEFLLLLGDMHFPMKAQVVPEAFRELLAPGAFSQVLCTGSLGSGAEALEYVKALGKNFHLVRGEYEDPATQTPEFRIVAAGKLKIGLVHGHQVIPWGDAESLNNFMREHDVDVVVSGHTHEQKCEKFDGRLFINPGSFTGAYGPLALDVEPGFVACEVREKSVEAFFYRLAKKEVVVSKASWTKGERK